MKTFIKKLLREFICENAITPEIVPDIDFSKIRIKTMLVNGIVAYIPFYGNERMGSFRVKPFKDGFRIFETVLYDKYRHKGVGKRMYYYIIKKLKSGGETLYSDKSQTDDAKHVWDSLIKLGVAMKTPEGYKSV
jgi:GNAT superfamily N-acetyltransferase